MHIILIKPLLTVHNISNIVKSYLLAELLRLHFLHQIHSRIENLIFMNAKSVSFL